MAGLRLTFLGNLGKDGICVQAKWLPLDGTGEWLSTAVGRRATYVGSDGRFKSEAVPSLCVSFLVAKSLFDNEHRKRHGSGLRTRCEADLEATVSSRAPREAFNVSEELSQHG